MAIRRRQKLVVGAVVVLCLLAIILFLAVRRDLRAASLLTRIADPSARGLIATYDRHAVDVSDLMILSDVGPVRARLYEPEGVRQAPGIVIVHGVHHLGLEEPRLNAFARAIAASGITVLTPELADIADYRITERSVDVIGAAARELSGRVGGAKVGVMGLSFSGGLSLLAAADPRYAGYVGFVVAVGAHDDLARVATFLATDRILMPDGQWRNTPAHEYGALILIYAHPEEFFSAADADTARETIRRQLWEQVNVARALLPAMSPEGRARMELLLAHRKSALEPELLASVEKHAAEMARVSPHGKLANLRAPVLLLHGSGDSVIPPSETDWLAREIPAGLLRNSLVTPVLTHVDVGSSSPLRDRLALVEFIADMLRESDHCVGKPAMPRQRPAAEWPLSSRAGSMRLTHDYAR
jgi:dienelactone hydrolase